MDTASGRVTLSSEMTAKAKKGESFLSKMKVSDGRSITLIVGCNGSNFNITLTADRTDDIQKWGLTLESDASEYYTGMMERVVDGPQQASWAPGIHGRAMNLRGPETGHARQADSLAVCAVLFIVARLCGLCKGGHGQAFDFDSHVRIDFVLGAGNLKVRHLK